MDKANLKDHRQIGQELEIFMVNELAPGTIFWLPKGMTIVKQLEKFIRSQNEIHGFQEVQTPILVKSDIFQQSGHFKYYEHSMYNMEIEHERYSLKPMNCPETALIYKSKTRSYKDLPLRYSEYGRLHRRELSGVVGGLLRVIEFTQDDGHVFLKSDQLENEVLSILKWVSQFHALMGFPSKFYLGTKPDKALGDAKIWQMAEASLKNALKKSGVNFEIREKDGVFYGPKIDIDITDIQNRTWTVSTIQTDFNIPKQFDLEYVDEDGKSQKPVMIHRSIIGSFERFIGILLEHYQGAFPVWLAPVQVVIMPITDRQEEHAKKIVEELKENGIRAELDNRAERLQAKIRDGSLQKVPYLGIIGDKEVQSYEESLISVRKRNGEDLGQLKLSDFIKRLKEEIDKKI
ncbi:MAG: threonine--tRNA ligase [Candidatus Levybacteria bacterium]|nr:threonine--tRNA ligase [Candidatus Levybacteria bacterium]